MKKNFLHGLAIILGIIVTMSVIGLGVIHVANERHEKELSYVKEQYETEIQRLHNNNDRLLIKLSELMCDLDSLELEVYKMMNDKDYRIIIELGDEIHIYEYEKKGLFGDKSHSVITTNMANEE